MEIKDGESFVVDCNVVVKWYFLEEHSESTKYLLESAVKKEIELYTPGVIIYEFANVLTKYNRQKIFSTSEFKDYYDAFIESCEMGIITIIPLDNERNNVLDLAFLKKISYYDAEYLYLAKKLKLSLITFDKHLKKIANR